MVIECLVFCFCVGDCFFFKKYFFLIIFLKDKLNLFEKFEFMVLMIFDVVCFDEFVVFVVIFVIFCVDFMRFLFVLNEELCMIDVFKYVDW